MGLAKDDANVRHKDCSRKTDQRRLDFAAGSLRDIARLHCDGLDRTEHQRPGDSSHDLPGFDFGVRDSAKRYSQQPVSTYGDGNRVFLRRTVIGLRRNIVGLAGS